MVNGAILIVEDEPDGQEVVAEILAHFNIPVEVVPSAEDALRLLSERQYAAIIIDLALPGMDGLSLLTYIRRNPQTAALPCLVITAYHSSLVKRQALEAGCNAYVPKPLEEAYFIQELNRVIANS